MRKQHPKLYKETMTTEEVVEAIDSINTKVAALKWLKRNKITHYRVDVRTVIWDREEVLNEK